MILSFRPQFLIYENGLPVRLVDGKIHTLRDDPTDRWKEGMMINFATGQRTPQYYQFDTGICKGTQRLIMTIESCDLIIYNGYELFSHEQKLQLSKNDGFKTYDDFYRWFMPIVIKRGGIYKPKIIHWTDFKY